MKILKKYNNFLSNIFESVIVANDDFLSILKSFPEGNKIADAIFSIIDDKKDVKTNYNVVSTSDKNNDEISFMSDAHYQRALLKNEDPWIKTKTTAKIGRMVRQILTDNGYIDIAKDSDIEKFVNLYKSYWDRKNGRTKREIKEVKGDLIKHWYLEDKYVEGGGSLNNSCMRYDTTNNLLNIYSENPEHVSLLILTEDGKLLGRALIWNLENGKKYLDRIYTVYDSDVLVMSDWFDSNYPDQIKKSDIGESRMKEQDMKVFLPNIVFERYPYMDTFAYVYRNIDKNKITTGDGFIWRQFSRYNDNYSEKYAIAQIQSTSGFPSEETHKYLKYKNIYAIAEDTTRIGDDFFLKSDCIKDYKGKYLSEDDAIFSEYIKEWVKKEDAETHPKHGIVPIGYFIECATEYKGDFIQPIDIYNDILKNGDKVLELKEVVKGDVSTFSLNIGSFRIYFDYNLHQNEVTTSDNVCTLFAYKVYETLENIENPEKYGFIKNRWNGRCYITKEDSRIWNIKISNETRYASAGFYADSHYKVNYESLIGEIKDSKASTITKNKKFKSLKSLDSYLKENNSDYRLSNYVLGKINVPKILSESFYSGWKKFKQQCFSYPIDNIISRTLQNSSITISLETANKIALIIELLGFVTWMDEEYRQGARPCLAIVEETLQKHQEESGEESELYNFLSNEEISNHTAQTIVSHCFSNGVEGRQSIRYCNAEFDRNNQEIAGFGNKIGSICNKEEVLSYYINNYFRKEENSPE